MQYYFKQGLTLSALTTKQLSLRIAPIGTIISGAGYGVFNLGSNEKFILALLNSNLINYLAQILSQKLNFEVNILQRLPIIIPCNGRNNVERIVNENIKLSKHEWDAFETSWDFKKHPLI